MTPPPREHRPGGDDLPFVFSGSLVVRGTGIGEVIATGALSEIGKIGQSLSTLETEPPRLQAQTRRLVRVFAMVGGGGQRPRGAALRHVARRMARRGARRHRARHVDAARGVSGRADGLHGHGRLAHLAGAGADPARRRDRDARLGDGPVHGQDRHADREPHVDRRAAARRTAKSFRPRDASGARLPEALPRPGRVRHARQRARPLRSDGEGVPRSRPPSIWPRPSTCTARTGRSFTRTGFAPISSPCRRSGRRRRPARIRRRGQGRAGGHRRSVPSRRRGRRRR